MRPLERTTPSGARRGRGLACILKSTLTPTASFGFVKLNNDGTVDVITSAVEHGQGAHTVLAQIAAEELGNLPVRVAQLDSRDDQLALLRAQPRQCPLVAVDGFLSDRFFERRSAVIFRP